MALVPILLALVFGNPVTQLVVVLIVFCTVLGSWTGAANVVAAFIGMLLALLLATPVGKSSEGLCAALFGWSGVENRLLSIATAAALIVAVSTILLSLLFRREIRKRSEWMRTNDRLGAFLGFGEGVSVALVVLWSLLAIGPMLVQYSAPVPSEGTSDGAFDVLRNVAESAQGSVAGRIAARSNPIEGVRAVSLTRSALMVMSDEDRLLRFTSDPAMQAIGERPLIRRVLERLAEELGPAEFKHGLSPEEVGRLFRNQRILELASDPDVLAELTPLVDQIEAALKAAATAQPPEHPAAPPQSPRRPNRRP